MYGAHFDEKTGYWFESGKVNCKTKAEAFKYLTSPTESWRAKYSQRRANRELEELEKDYYDPNNIISYFRRVGKENVRIFAQMPTVEAIIPFMGLMMCSDNRSWVECWIDEDRYKLHEHYKITLRPITPYQRYFGSENYYQSDFQDMLEKGFFMIKTEEGQHIEHIKWFEEIPGSSAVLAHEADVLVGSDGKICLKEAS